MNAIFRSLLIWLVMLALPFQGFAAAAALPCDAGVASVRGHHAMPAAANHDHQAKLLAATHDHPAMSMATAPHDHHAMLMAGGPHDHHAMPLAAAGHAAHPAHDGGIHSKCGSCPACWASPAMLPPAFAQVGAAPAVRASIPFAPGYMPSVHPSLPERPPRPALA